MPLAITGCPERFVLIGGDERHPADRAAAVVGGNDRFTEACFSNAFCGGAASPRSDSPNARRALGALLSQAEMKHGSSAPVEEEASTLTAH
jgi:hypothetical protein